MSKYAVGLLISQIVLFSQLSYAENYEECIYRCEQDFTDCVNEPQDPDPEVQAAKERACDQKRQYCYSECEKLKPVDTDIAPEVNPNVIRK